MKEKRLEIYSYIYLILPIIVFVIGWTKPIIGFFSTTLLLVILFKKIKENITQEEDVFISKKNLKIIFLIILVICISAGQGGLFYQSNDWHWRNAIFRDLINLDWPVYYEQMDASLTYYVGIWMVPAIIGKIMLKIYSPLAWPIANIALLLWCCIGVTLTILWMIKLIKVKKLRNIILGIAIFLGFSGLDMVGILITKSQYSLDALHLEWWASLYQYSSMITQLFWVFNQCIVAWLITMIFLSEKNVKNYMLIILLCLPYGPLPFLGLIPLFAVKGISYLIEAIKKKEVKKFIKDIFTIENIFSFIAILPIYYLYYSNNAATTDGGFRIFTEVLNLKGITYLITFYLIEVGLYGLILLKDNKKDLIFITSLITLLIVPVFKLGLDSDLAMRGSIPALVVINYYLVKYILEAIENKKLTYRTIIIIMVFIIGLITPLYEYRRAFTRIGEEHKINLVADSIITFSNKSIEDYENFLCANPKEKSIFFKYIAK